MKGLLSHMPFKMSGMTTGIDTVAFSCCVRLLPS